MWSHWSRGAIVTVFALTCCLGFAAAVGGATRAGPKGPRADGASVSVAAHDPSLGRALAGAVRIAPANGTTDFGPGLPVVVDAADGHLASVRVVATTGVSIEGRLAPSGEWWQSIAPLAYGTTYRVAATVTGANDARAQLTSTFRTLAPAATVSATVFPTDGLAVGVGQPVVFRFSQFISSAAAQQAVLSHLNVTESQPVLGGWHWFSNDELHFRPAAYWPAHEKVTVTWNLSGWNTGNGSWGDGQGIAHFSVGDARVSFANLDTHEMTVTDNGRVVARYPISGGKATDPTMDGVHIVLDRSSVVRMDSATNGVPVNSPDGYDELVYSDVHISDSGEYVHAAPWSVGEQGFSNVSHGCINLSPANAAAFFAFSRVGDVVLVAGSPRPPSIGDHGVMDWDTSWDQFTAANAILRVPASISTLG